MKENRKELILYFIFFLAILFLSPISGDDWGNYLIGKHGLIYDFRSAFSLYFSWEGRLISRILINLLTYNKIIWNIANSFLIVSIIYLTNKICNFKNKKIKYLLLFSVFLFMNIYTFSQVVTWIAGNITYLFVIPLIFLYIFLIRKNDKYSKAKIILLIILNIIIPMFIENMSLVFIFINLIFLIEYYIKNKKINKNLLLFLIISIASFLIMFMSPGNRIRSSVENIEFNKLSLFGKIGFNSYNFVFYTYIINYFLIILMIISMFILIRKNIKNKLLKVILYLYESISLIFTFTYLLSSFKIVVFNIPNIYAILYFIFLTIINFILIIKDDSIKSLESFFYMIGIISNLVMLLSPTWGYRTSFGAYLFMSISFIIIIDKYIKENNHIKNFLIILNVLGAIFYLVFYINIFRCYNNNLKEIKKKVKENKEEIIIDSYPSFAPCNINPTNKYHIDKFKKYYGIKKNVNISLNDGKWKLIIYKK